MRKHLLARAFLVASLCYPLYTFAQEHPTSDKSTAGLPEAGKGVSPLPAEASAKADGTTYAVVVGISDYQDPAIADLKYADRDAEAFANFLRSSVGGRLDADHLKLMLNEEATSGQMAAALDWLIEVCQEGDKAIIYFSGHGDVEGKKITQPGFLLCWDSPPQTYMAGGTYSVYFLQLAVKTLSLQNKAKTIVITDACRSGKLAGNDIGGAQLTSQNLAEQFANEIKILSCQPDEYSIEGEQWGGGRGAFSYHLLDGLYGMADKNNDRAVSLLEMRTYLEENVSREVAPHSQIPLVRGNIKELLANVDPTILDQVRQQKAGQIAQFKSTESRGIEETVLSNVDSSTAQLYVRFKKALLAKQFLFPENDCAEYYYSLLIKEPKLDKLHSAMRRNYAAALQDDAQQVLNLMLKSDPSICLKMIEGYRITYRHYPQYLERAASLLGNAHYMYNTIMARKYFFEGYLTALGKPQNGGFDKVEFARKVLDKYFTALRYQPNMPQAWLKIADQYAFELDQIDSAEYYISKAIEASPNWVLPYTLMASANVEKHHLEEAKSWLDKAWQLDSNSVVVLVRIGEWYSIRNRFEEALTCLLKSLEMDPTVPCNYFQMGMLYERLGQYEASMRMYEKAINLDSTFFNERLFSVYYVNQEYEKALKVAELSLQRNPDNAGANNITAFTLRSFGRNEEAEALLKKASMLEPANYLYPCNLANFYIEDGRFEEAEQLLFKARSINPTGERCHVGLFMLYLVTGREAEAEKAFRQAMQTDSLLPILYLGRNYKAFVWKELPEHALINYFDLFFEKIIEWYPDNPTVNYEYAKILAQRGDKRVALEQLESALEKGFDQFELLQKDHNLDPIRSAPGWDDLIVKYFPDQYKD
ncbi:MAG: caspase family protein [Lewinellaceae bacterium]|nr:caspase family protein [Lewinellaceae bacterium]